MKRYIIPFLLISFLATSCVTKVDDLFDKSASERVEQGIKDLETLLRSSEHGWLMQYYPERNQKYGGFNIYLNFIDEEYVTVETDISAPTAETSTYSVKGDMGITLNFDTYNTLLHFFSDPSLNIGGGTGLGLEGDYEFVFIEGSNDIIELKGKKTQNTMYLVRVTSADYWDQYVKGVHKVLEAMDEIPFGRLLGKSGNVEISFLLNEDDRNLYVELEDGDVLERHGYRPTSTGIQMIEPVTIGDISIDSFTYNNDYTLTGHSSQGDILFEPAPRLDYLELDELIGSYKLTSSSQSNVNVTISKIDDATALISGVTNWDFIANYNNVTGRLELGPQILTQLSNGYSVMIAPLSPALSLWANPAYPLGQEALWNKDEENFVLTWSDLGNYPQEITGWILWQLSPTGVSSGEYTGVSPSRFQNMVMTKQ